MNTPLYARMNEFAPASSGISEADSTHVASHDASHDGQGERQNEVQVEEQEVGQDAGQDEGHNEGHNDGSLEQSGEYGSLFEQCSLPVGKFTANAGEGEVAATWAGRAQRGTLAAEVPDLKIGNALAEGSLADGYKLHEVALFDSRRFDKELKSGGMFAIPGQDFEQITPAQSSIVPSLDLDYSA
jgi:hypothetical protein